MQNFLFLKDSEMGLKYIQGHNIFNLSEFRTKLLLAFLGMDYGQIYLHFLTLFCHLFVFIQVRVLWIYITGQLEFHLLVVRDKD